MTDEHKTPSTLTVRAMGMQVAQCVLEDDPADSRGVLSWHYQARERYLDEAGSYGYFIRCDLPEEVLALAREKGALEIELSADNGLALYGRNAGRYAMDLEIVEA